MILIPILLLISTASAVDSTAVEDKPYLTSNHQINCSESDNLLKDSNSSQYKSDELFVKFKSDAPKQTSKNAHLKVGSTVLKEYDEIKGLQLVKIPENISLSDALSKYRQNKNVIYAEPNYVYKKDTIPDDKDYNKLWGLEKIKAPAAWDITTGSKDTVIAIIDSGINTLHPDLIDNIWINTGEIAGNGIDDDKNGYIDDTNGWNFLDNSSNVTDKNGHGTHVAGIIAATGNNSLGVTGIMWNAQIMVLKFLDEDGLGYIEDAVSAVIYASKMGASIISNSWGGNAYSQALKDAIDASPALVVCASGNEFIGLDNDVYRVYPASFTSNNIISVASSDLNDHIAIFSNFGENSVDVAAPGNNIYSTLSESYGYLSGTSMATPYVSGLAGLIKSFRPELNNLQIKNTILNNVDFISSLTGKVLTSGRINAYNALNNIITDTTIPTASVNIRGGKYYTPISLKLTGSDCSNIYYTLDGKSPTVFSSVYSSPIHLSATKVLKFIAVNPSGTISTVYKETYYIYELITYKYTVKVKYKKKYTVQYKKWYKKWYRSGGKWKYKWRYKWKFKSAYRGLYRKEIRYGKKYVLKH